MRILLDTHVWLWMVLDPGRIRPSIRKHLERADTALFLSAASVWEMAIKYGLGRLPMPEPPSSFVPPRLVRDGVSALPVDVLHASAVAELPAVHADPFDRLLIAQARIEGLSLLTADGVLRRYEVDVLWAGPG